MEEVADWDLLAVVRGCYSTSRAPPPPPPQPTPAPPPPPPSYYPGCQDLQDLYKPFMKEPIIPQQQILFQQQQPPQGLTEPHQLVFGNSTIPSHHKQRPKKRKNLQKKVCHLPVEGLSTDMWAWRKYGQKPIKGSPYPRGYYKCSSSKGCPARKQVERNRSNPKMFIITYTSEHSHPMPTHRNSLAGSTRHKAGTGSPGEDAHAAAAAVASEEEEVFPADMGLDDDFFSELEDMGMGVDFLDEQSWESGLLHS